MTITVTKEDGTKEEIIHVMSVKTEAESIWLEISYSDGISPNPIQRKFGTGAWKECTIKTINVGGY